MRKLLILPFVGWALCSPASALEDNQMLVVAVYLFYSDMCPQQVVEFGGVPVQTIIEKIGSDGPQGKVVLLKILDKLIQISSETGVTKHDIGTDKGIAFCIQYREQVAPAAKVLTEYYGN